MTVSRFLVLPVLVGSGLVAACSRTPTRVHPEQVSPAGGHLITAAMISKGGSRTAWDVLRRHASYLALSEDRAGQPRFMSRRGRSSFVLSDVPIILVDDVKMPDLRLLKELPADEIATVRILGAIDGSTYYGANAVGGVIDIRTKVGGEEPARP